MELPRWTERTIHFVRRDSGRSVHAMLARRFEQHFGADHVRVNKIGRILIRPVTCDSAAKFTIA